MTQESLLEESAKLRKDAKETSRLAALKAAPKAGSQRLRVLQQIFQMHGLTDDEIANFTAIPSNSVRPRRVELVEGGWVEDSGKRRESDFGNPAIVWRVTDKALKMLRGPGGNA